ncbi:hypothetical protein FQN54_000126 [Arachnomyces sp. PD_36]|nr:hypothetical protein FQN54_000126 [Arachnomyces sp. PD_36]
MSSTANNNYITAEKLTTTGYTFIGVTSAFCISRFSLRLWRAAGFQMDDLFMLLAWLFFLGLAINYIVITPILYRVTAVQMGEEMLYVDLEDDALLMIKIFFANTMLFWFSLWSVKISLLFLYRRLMKGLPQLMRWWWVVMGFTLVSLVGCVVSNFTSCSSMHAWFTVGLCATHRDAVAQIASLYFSFAVDVITDIMIMILPIRVIWNLHMPLSQRISIGGIFSVGVLCIVMACVRVVQIGVKSNSNSTPSSSWLALWGITEAGLAVIIGCLPSFAFIYRREKNSRREYSYGNASSRSNHRRHQSIPLSDKVSSTSRVRPLYSEAIWDGPSLSQERLAKPGSIAVRQSLRVQEHRLYTRNP